MLLGERHQAVLNAWPVAAGGGKAGAYQVLLHTVDLVGKPLTPLPGGALLLATPHPPLAASQPTAWLASQPGYTYTKAH